MKRMKNMNILTVLTSLLLMIGLSGCYHKEPREEILKVYNWGDYIDEQVLADFPKWYEEQTRKHIRVIYQTFDINEIMLTKIERGHEDYDVVCPSEYIIERMLKKNILLPIDTNFGKTPNYIANLSPYIRKELNEVSQPGRSADVYAVGYMWGTAGILYNKRMANLEEASTWGSLWNPHFKGQLLMKDSYRDAYGTAIIYAHRDELASGKLKVTDLMNNYSDEAIAIAEEQLKAMKPNIAGWEADFGKEMMTKGKIALNMTWSGDAVWAIEEAKAIGVDLDYVVPREGSNIWFDGWVIPKYSKNPKAASYFINYLCKPEVALANMDAIGYVSAVATPEILAAKIDTTLEETVNLTYFFGPEARSVKVNPIQYPDSAVIARCAMIHDSGKRTEKVLEMWSHVKGDNLEAGIVILIFVTIGGLIVYKIIIILRKKERDRMQRMARKKRIKATQKKLAEQKKLAAQKNAQLKAKNQLTKSQLKSLK